jgi:hypothetical protein
MDTLTRKILAYIKDNPGRTSQDIFIGLPRYNSDEIWRRIVQLAYAYEIENRGGAGRAEDVQWHILEWQPTEFFLELSSDLLKELKNISPRKKRLFLARRLQLLLEDEKGEA